jgi:lipoprotein-anchoring transpeptidase ErfK/SrfK
MSSAPRSFRRLAAPLLVLAVAVVGCSKGSSGDNFQFSAEQLSPGTTVASAPTSTDALKPAATEIATAKIAEVNVYAQKPASAGAGDNTLGGATPAVYDASAAVVPPIPRDGYATAGSRKTPQGWAFANPTYFKSPLVFEVIGHDGDWLHVWVPARPNQQQGWIRATDVDLTSTTFRMELSVADHHLKVWNGDQLFVDTNVVDGKSTSKTPLGHFYINEKIKSDNPAGAYGYWILSTSGYSEDLNEFDNGLPVVAFHGTNQPNLIGQSQSNGCVRMPNDVDQKLADALPAGTPIDISA